MNISMSLAVLTCCAAVPAALPLLLLLHSHNNHKYEYDICTLVALRICNPCCHHCCCCHHNSPANHMFDICYPTGPQAAKKGDSLSVIGFRA